MLVIIEKAPKTTIYEVTMKDSHTTHNAKNSLMLTIAALIWGFAFVAQSSGGDVVGAYSFNSVRNFLGSAVLIPIMLIFDRIGISKKPATKAQTKELWIAGILTGTALAVASNLQQVGITLGTTTGKAGFLTACYIILVPIFGIFMKKKCPINVWIAVVMALIGLYLLCITGKFVLSLPDILLLLCAASFAIQIHCVDFFAPRVDNVRFASIQFLTCGVLSSIPALFTEVGFSAESIRVWAYSFTTWSAWLPILYAGLCSSGIAYTLQVFGQRDFNPTIASLIMSLESVFSLIGGWLLLNQKLSYRELIGCAIIFVAIIFSQIPMPKFGKS